MYEDQADIDWLQQLLSKSHGSSSDHLRSIVEGDTYGVLTHGDAEFLVADHPDRGWIEDHLIRHYGTSPSTWGPDIVYLRIQPRWMVGYDSAGSG